MYLFPSYFIDLKSKKCNVCFKYYLFIAILK